MQMMSSKGRGVVSVLALDLVWSYFFLVSVKSAPDRFGASWRLASVPFFWLISVLVSARFSFSSSFVL